MKQNFIAIAILMSALLIAAGLAWAMSPTPICFYDTHNSCAVVTSTNPLPTVTISP